MSGIPNAIAAALAAEIRSRREWDEAPALYTLYVEGGRPRLRQIPVPDRMWAGPPAQILLAMADGMAEFAPLLQSAAGPGLYGAAFRCEAWGVHAPQGDREAIRQMIADGNARRISTRPDRVEVRQFWAVDRARVTYMASQERGSDEVATDVRRPEPGMDHTGDIFTALDRLVSAFLGVTLPERSLNMEEPPMPDPDSDWDTVMEQRAESERDHFFPVADEDADFADEWDDADSNAYQDRVEAGLEQEDSSDGN